MNITPASLPTILAISNDFVMLTGKGGAHAYHIASGDEMNKEGFIQYCTRHYGNVAMVDNDGNHRTMSAGAVWWIWSDESKRTVRRIVMEPTMLDEKNDDPTVFNRWHKLKEEMVPPDLSATFDDIKPLVDHLLFISDGDKEGVAYFLNWLAWQYLHPGMKIPTCIMMYSRWTGVGKTMIADLLGKVFGQTLVSSINGLALHKNFMDAMEHKRLVVLNELARTDKRDGYERFKSLVSEGRMDFEGKGRASKEIKNTLHFIVTTNNADALPLMDGDRRVLVLRCEAKAKEPAYYMDLAAWMNGEGATLVAGVFARWQFPADWNYSAPVPQTSATMAAQEESKGELHTFLKELIEQGAQPFDKDMGRCSVLIEQLHTLYPGNVKGMKMNNKTLPAVLTGLGAEQMGTNWTNRKGSKIYAGIWCWRNQDKWRVATGDDRAAHFDV